MPGQLRNSDTGIECPKYQSFRWLGRSKPGASLTRQIILEPGGSVEQVRDFRTLSISFDLPLLVASPAVGLVNTPGRGGHELLRPHGPEGIGRPRLHRP